MKISNVEGSGDGLFTKRDIRRGEIISFYSGFYVSGKLITNPLDRRQWFMTDKEKLKDRM